MGLFLDFALSLLLILQKLPSPDSGYCSTLSVLAAFNACAAAALLPKVQLLAQQQHTSVTGVLVASSTSW